MMIAITSNNVSEERIQEIVHHIEQYGLQAHVSRGTDRTVIGIIGKFQPALAEQLRQIRVFRARQILIRVRALLILYPQADTDCFLSALDSNGNFLWALSYGGNLSDRTANLFMDASGNFYTSGTFTDSVDFDPGAGTDFLSSSGSEDGFVQKLSPQCSFPTLPVLSASPDTLCLGDTATLSIASGLLNDATHWQWYADSCNGTPADTGSSILVCTNLFCSLFCEGRRRMCI